MSGDFFFYSFFFLHAVFRGCLGEGCKWCMLVGWVVFFFMAKKGEIVFEGRIVHEKWGLETTTAFGLVSPEKTGLLIQWVLAVHGVARWQSQFYGVMPY